jgi:plasmid stabilization system protein ParE
MKVRWTRAALADVRTVVPEGFRPHLQRYLQGLVFTRQGRRCTAMRYPDAYFLKYRHWLVMYLVIGEEEIGVIGVEYNYGQPV